MALDRVCRNTAYVMAGEMLSKLMEFAFVIMAARSLGPEGFGLLSSGLAYVGLYFFLTDLGLTQLAAREVAKDRANAAKLMAGVAAAKAVLNATAYVLMAALAYSVGYPAGFIFLVLVLGLSSVFESYSYVFNSVFQGYERLEHAAVSRVCSSAVLLVAGFLALLLEGGVAGYALAYVASRLAGAAYGVYASGRYVRLGFSFDTAAWMRLIGESWPFGLTLVATGVFMSVDVVLVSRFLGSGEAGVYAAASRLVIALGFILAAYNQSVYPALSEAAGRRTAYNSISGYYLNSMLFIAVPMAAVTSANSGDIIGLAYSAEYAASAPLLSALVWWMAVAFVSSPYHRALEAAGMQRRVMEAVIVGTALTVSLDVLLIPRYGAIAAAYAAALGQLVFLALPASVCARKGLSPAVTIGDVSRLCAGAVVLAAAMAYTKDSAAIIRITLPLTAYVAAYIMLGGAKRIMPTGNLRQ